MGNTGMFLLEDSGLQALNTPAFLPFGWTWSDGEARTRSSTAELSHMPSPVSSMTAATFPAVTTPFASPVSSPPFTGHFAATMNSPQSVPASRRPNPSQPMPFGYYGNPNSFTHVDVSPAVPNTASLHCSYVFSHTPKTVAAPRIPNYLALD